jgi:predicted AAA+ superfamily ATPase
MRRFIPRAIGPELKAAARDFPVLALTGPRQTGKSTLLRRLFPSHSYATLDDPLTRASAAADPRDFLRAERSLIIDEIQHLPELLPHLKIAVDEDRGRKGRFILTGSQHFPLMAGLGESLAGRIALHELLGFSGEEVGYAKDPFAFMHRGSYPEVVAQGADRDRFYASYVQTYLERDIRQITSVHDLRTFQSFLELLAARAGALLNLNELSKECGVSFTTARRWLSLLETTRIVYLLRPYSRNVSKRVIKSPKVYFTDVGLLSYLLRYPTPQVMRKGPMAGAFFENLIVTEVLKHRFNHKLDFELYFYRDSNGNELDLLIDLGLTRRAVEIKATSTPSPSHLEVLRRRMSELGAASGHLVTTCPHRTRAGGGVQALPWDEAASALCSGS